MLSTLLAVIYARLDGPQRRFNGRHRAHLSGAAARLETRFPADDAAEIFSLRRAAAVAYHLRRRLLPSKLTH
jgi:hypothetical protein